MIRPRLAPSAARTVSSRSRAVARASSMLATLQQAMTTSRPTAANNVYSVCRNRPTTQSMMVMTWTRAFSG